jgi:hypothetical protein
VAISGGNASEIDFTAVKNPGTYSISGTIGGDVLVGVAVTLSGALDSSTETGVDGSYSFNGLSDGIYLVKPSLSGYCFAPASQNVTINGADQAGIDFTASAINISGTISKLSFSSSHRESVIQIAGAYEQYSCDRFTITAVVQFPVDFDLSLLSANTAADTEFSLDFGFYSFSGTLDQSVKSKFKGLKGGSVSFKASEMDEIKGKTVTVERIDVKWDKKRKLTVRISGTPVLNSGTNVVDLSAEEDNNKISGTIDVFEVMFKDAEAGFGEGESLSFTGRKKTQPVTKGKDEGAEEFELIIWSARGKKL